MIVNPKTAIEKGWITFPTIEMENEQLQPNGIDLRIKWAIEIPQEFNFSLTKKGATNNLHKTAWYKNKVEKAFSVEHFTLFPFTAYVVESYEYVCIPKGVVAFVYGRSTLNRNGVLVRSSVYDSGFKNFVGFTIYPFTLLTIQRETRVAQLVFFEANSSELYNGQYQDRIER